MNKKHLTLSDLKEQGLVLSKTDAQELHHHISRIAQHGSNSDVIFDGEDDSDELDITEVDLKANDDYLEKRYAARKRQLEGIGAVYSTADDGFNCGESFIYDDGLMMGDDDDFEETLELAMMGLEAAKKKAENDGDLVNSTEDNDDSSKLTESQEDELLAFLGLTKENSPEEYYAALYDYISTSQSDDPKLLKKLQELSDHLGTNASDKAPGIKIQRPLPGEHHATKKKRQKEQGLQDHVVSQEDLDNIPELIEAGVKVGDTIEISAESAE